VVVLVVGVLCVSSAAVLIRLAAAPPLVIAAYRLLFASAVVIPLALVLARDELVGLDRADLRRIVASGLLLALHFALWITSLEYTSVASSVVLVTTSPLWVALAAPYVLHEPVPRKMYAGVGLAFVGVAVIARGDIAFGRDAVVGDLLALGGALAVAAYFIIGRGVRGHVSLLAYVAVAYGTAAAALVVAALASGAQMIGYARETWAYMLALALGPQILGHSSFNWALRRLSAPFVAATVLAESVGSVVLAWLVLSEKPPHTTLLGGALILAGLFISASAEAASDRSRPRPGQS
jgi:drug/metabolite transporter (DMT)-like permease